MAQLDGINRELFALAIVAEGLRFRELAQGPLLQSVVATPTHDYGLINGMAHDYELINVVAHDYGFINSVAHDE